MTATILYCSVKYGNFSILIDKEDSDKIIRGWIYLVGSHTKKKVQEYWTVMFNTYDKITKKTIRQSLGRYLLKAPQGLYVDHINGNPLDNRKANLRIVSLVENNQNLTRLKQNNTSGYRGVSWCKTNNKWRASYQYNYKRKYLGYFTKKEDAVRIVEQARSECYVT